MRVLYDGWSLVRNPLSPSALHLLALLEHLPDEIAPVVALPEPAPKWMADIPVEIHSTPNTPSGRLRWEQVRIPRLGRELGSELMHLTAPTAPLVSGMPTLFSPTAYGAGADDSAGGTRSSLEPTSFVTRLRRSFAQGGMAQVKEVLWPMDLPRPELHGSLVDLPPVLPLDFISRTDQSILSPSSKVDSSGDRYVDLELSESFILYHGPLDRGSLKRLLQAWSWAADPIGASAPLLVIGLEGLRENIFLDLVEEFHLGDSIHLRCSVEPDLLPLLYRDCTAVFHPAPVSPWCGPVRLALASGKPLVASETPNSEAIAGPAAFLVDERDSRALGAALVTVVVEEQVAESLSAAAVTRTASWISPDFGELLHLRYCAALEESG